MVEVIPVQVFGPRARAVPGEIDRMAVVAEIAEVGQEVGVPAAGVDIAAMHENQRRMSVGLFRGAMQGM